MALSLLKVGLMTIQRTRIGTRVGCLVVALATGCESTVTDEGESSEGGGGSETVQGGGAAQGGSSPGSGCDVRGKHYAEGEIIVGPSCERTQCIGGEEQFVGADCALPGCDYQDVHYDVDDSFPSADGCNTCTCVEDGFIACTEMACAGCYHDDEHFIVGDSYIQSDGCTECTCNEDGTFDCYDGLCDCDLFCDEAPPIEGTECDPDVDCGKCTYDSGCGTVTFICDGGYWGAEENGVACTNVCPEALPVESTECAGFDEPCVYPLENGCSSTQASCVDGKWELSELAIVVCEQPMCPDTQPEDGSACDYHPCCGGAMACVYETAITSTFDCTKEGVWIEHQGV